MAPEPIGFVVTDREGLQDPFHDARESCRACWLEDQMKMVAHDDEVVEAKIKLLMGTGQNVDKHLLYRVVVHQESLMVGTGGDMVPSGILEDSRLSHTCHNEVFSVLASKI